jgi:hypothetical protein
MFLGKPIGQMVKGASKVIQGVASDKPNVQRDYPDIDKILSNLSGLPIALDPGSIWLGFYEEITKDIQITDVLIGPFNLGID